MASIQKLTAQVVALTDQDHVLTDSLTVAEQSATLQTQTGTRGSDNVVFDKKRFYPKEMKDSTSFRSWSECFIDWITMHIDEIGQAFQRAGKQEDVLDVSA